MPVKKTNPTNQPAIHINQPACALGSPCFGSMVTKSRPSLDGSVRPPGGFSNTNSQATPKEAFLSTRRSFGWKNPNLWEDILVEKNLAFLLDMFFLFVVDLQVDEYL